VVILITNNIERYLNHVKISKMKTRKITSVVEKHLLREAQRRGAKANKEFKSKYNYIPQPEMVFVNTWKLIEPNVEA
jgi:hypothetical protein